MKRSYIKLFSILTAAMLLGSCKSGNGGTTAAAGISGASDTPDALINEIVSDASEQSGSAAVDLDLTVMSSTMVYATVYNIITDPQTYAGKTVKLAGYFDTSYNEQLNVRYYFVVIPDATACCTQGLEFICRAKQNYPDDYPKPGTDIEITGTIDSYDEEGRTYYYVDTNDMKQL